MALPFSDLARFVGMEPAEAQDALHRLVDDIRTALASEGHCDVEGVGRFVRRNGTVSFQADPYLSTLVNGQFAGLDAVALPDYQALSAPETPAEQADPDAFPGFDAGEAEWGDERVPWAIETNDTPPEPPAAAAPPPPVAETPVEEPPFQAYEPPAPADEPPPPAEPEPPASNDVFADPFADSDLFTDIWDEPGPPEDEHPLGPASAPRFEEADFNVVSDPAPDDVPPPRTRQEAASHADDLFSWFQRNPDEARAADALLLAARRYEEAGMMQEAGQLFSEFVKRFPDHPQTNAARRSLGWMEVGPDEQADTPDVPPPPPPPEEPPRERSPLTLVTPPVPPPHPDTNTAFQAWSSDDAPTEPPAPPPQPPRTAEPPAADAPPRFEMGPPDGNQPLPPPPRRHGNLSVPTTVIEARRKARRDQDRKRTRLGVIIVMAVLLFALILALWYTYLRPGTTPTTPVTDTSEQVEPLPEEPAVTDPDVAPAEPETAAFDPFRSADPIDPLAGGWMWVMGSYPTQASATEAAETYRAQGFRTGAVPGLANGRRVFRVGIGQFETPEAAQAVEGELPETVAPGRPWLRQIGT